MTLLVALLVTLLAAPPSTSVHAASVITTIPLHGLMPKTYTPLELSVAVNPNTDRVYVADVANNWLAVIDGSTDSLVTTLVVANPTSVAVNPNTDRVYVTSGTSIVVIDGGTDSVVTSIPMLAAANALAVDPASNRVYAVTADDAVAVINGATNSIVTTVTGPPTVKGCSYALIEPAVDWVTDTVYVDARSSCQFGNFVEAIDGATNSVSTMISNPFTSDAWGLAVDPASNRVYVSEDVANQVQVIDGSSDTVSATVSTGIAIANRTYDVAVDPATNRVYLSMYGGKAATIMDGSTNALLQTLGVMTTPEGVGVNPSTGRVYLFNYFNDTVSVIQDAPPSPPTAQLTINTQDTSSQTITGYYTVLNESGSVVSTGFSPQIFTLNAGQVYSVGVDNFGSCTFDHWADTGSTTAQRTISISGDTNLSAVYRCGAGATALTVQSADENGNPIAGYYTFVSEDGSQVGAGFTPFTLAPLSPGHTYSVQADSFASCTFDHWSDGVTSDPRSLTASGSAMTVVAVYDCGSTISISAENSSSSPLTGYYTTLWQGGVVLGSCFSPCGFAVGVGQSYQVAVADYGGEAFGHWSDGTLTRFNTIDVPSTNSVISLTAIYTP